MTETLPVQYVDEPIELLTPREQRLERAAQVLRWGALAHGAAVILLLVLALLGGALLLPGVFTGAQVVLLARLALAADEAFAVVILLLLVNLSLLLVLMVGLLAREFWVLPAMALLIAANGGALVLLGFTPAILTIAAVVWAGAIILRDARAFRINPVMLKELRGRMRGVRAFMVMTIYLGLMSAFTVLLYLIYTSSTVLATGSAVLGSVGRVLFMGLVGLELLLIVFIAPAFTAGAVTGERERQTYDLLRTTLLASPSFLIGKLESALGYILLLLLAAIPLQSVAFLFGGVTEAELLIAFVVLTVTAVTLGTVGIFFSSIMERTVAASVRSYVVALAVMFGIPVLMTLPFLNAFANAVGGFSTGITLSPVVESVSIYIGLVLVSLNPVLTAIISQNLLADRQVMGFWTMTLTSDGSQIPLISPWITFTVFYLVIATVLIVNAVRRMRRMEA